MHKHFQKVGLVVAGFALAAITGAIADYGHDHSVGKTNFQKIVLSKGSFEINATKLNKSFKGTVNKKACSIIETAHGANMPLSKGTGLYKGIKGVVTLRATVALIGKTVKGKCALNVEPAAQNSVVLGKGKVSY